MSEGEATVATTLTTRQARAVLADDVRLRPRRTPLGDTIRTLGHNRIAVGGLAVVLIWLVLGILAPVLPLQDPNYVDVMNKLKAPDGHNPLGTDDLGRDMFSRVIYGARRSLPAGLIVIAISGTIGCVLGAVAGYIGGYIDSLIMRISDAVLSFPSIILAMAITAIIGEPSLLNAMIAVALVLWPEYARVMRGQVLAIRTHEFVTAAESVGASRARVLFRHILPSTDAPIIVKSTLDVGSAIVLTAGLSFLGLGAVPPDAEWGAMINQGFRKGLQFWWYSAVPGFAIMSVVMALNFFGDGLRDALDPRRRGR